MNFEPVQTSSMSVKDKLKNLLWEIINKTLFRFSPPFLSVFRKYRICLIRMFGGRLDWNVSVHPKAIIDYPWNLTMKNKSSLGEGCWVYALAPITIGACTCVGKDVYLLTGTHDIEKRTFDLITKPITIGKGCWIATSSIILPGVTIEEYVVVAANSVVTKDIAPNAVVGGNPAKFIKNRIIKE